MEKQRSVTEEELDAVEAEVEIEFIGTLEEVTRGPVGPTQDSFIGDEEP